MLIVATGLKHVAIAPHEYPCGVDFVLVDVEGHVVGIPRTTKILSVEKEGAAWDM